MHLTANWGKDSMEAQLGSIRLTMTIFLQRSCRYQGHVRAAVIESKDVRIDDVCRSAYP